MVRNKCDNIPGNRTYALPLGQWIQQKSGQRAHLRRTPDRCQQCSMFKPANDVRIIVGPPAAATTFVTGLNSTQPVAASIPSQRGPPRAASARNRSLLGLKPFGETSRKLVSDRRPSPWLRNAFPANPAAVRANPPRFAPPTETTRERRYVPESIGSTRHGPWQSVTRLPGGVPVRNGQD